MTEEDIKIKYEGFSPSSEILIYFKELFETLRHEAPTWSSIVAIIRQDSEDCFRGTVKITSSEGEFSESDEAGNPRDLGTKLFGHTQRQLDYWKSERTL
jgi:hypothetical protein